MKLLIIFCLITPIIIGCKHLGSENAKSDHWESLTIISDNHQVINVSNNNDTSIVKSYDNGSIFQGFHKNKVDSLKVYFSQAEKDTLFKLSRDIITNAAPSAQHCTDFVGDLKLTIYYDRFVQQSISYSGICKWDSLSPQTIHLYHLLKRRIKWWNNNQRLN